MSRSGLSAEGYWLAGADQTKMDWNLDVGLRGATARQFWARTGRLSSLIPTLVYLIVAAGIAFFGWLSVLRHQTFQSNAMDLGYTDQVVWNTLHGRFMRFSTYENAPIDLPLEAFRRTDTLLAYHVEPLLVPISLLYLVYDSPVSLLVFQAVVLGLGALPAYWLARDHLGSQFAGLVFSLVYLLAPAVEGANLSDFHAVSLTASLLLFALYFLRTRRFRPFFAAIVMAMSAKEDISLLVLMIGLYSIFWIGERRVGALTAMMGLSWFLFCTQVILPYYSGLPISPFLHRVTLFGPTFQDSLLSILREPQLLLRWIRQPEIVAYVRGLLASAGYTPLFSPVTLILSAPVLGMNVFSTWDWTYSEGAHYSASIIPFIIFSGVHGTGFLSRQLAVRWKVPHRWAVNGLAGLVLLIGGYHHHRIGMSPLAGGFQPPRFAPHHRLAQELMGLIPGNAAVSAQSALYPHLAHREKAYLFPAVNDAEYVFLDVTSPSHPISNMDVYRRIQGLLSSQEFGLVAADDGYLLFQRGASQIASPGLPDSFYGFAQAAEHEVAKPLRATFGGELELLGYDFSLPTTIHAHQRRATVTTYWRTKQPLAEPYLPAFFFSRRDGAIVGHYAGVTPAGLWYPSHLWRVGEVIRIETPIVSVGPGHDALVAVVFPLADPWSVAGRLRPISRTDAQPLEVFQDGSLLKLFTFP